MTPTAAIIIPHHADLVRLERCLAALAPQLGPEIEAVVVDNAPAEPLPEALRTRFAALRFVVEPAAGAAHARNRGVAETSAPLLVFLDCDCLPDPGWLQRALDAARAHPGALVGGRVSVFDETPPPRSGAEAFEAVFAFDNRAYIERKGFSVTANLLAPRAVFERVGGFRPGLSEDLDWCRRATAAGAPLVYDDGLHVAHPSRSDWPALARKWRRLTDEAWGLQGRGLRARSLWALRALAMPLSALAHLPKVLRSSRLRSPREKARATATLFRLRIARGVWMLVQAGKPVRNREKPC
ncbi:glycosyltransferase family 2 protein [Salipiger sp. 1_MG-2023]|uniref:glycosyltransferase family 2 protein n=1 Tax=Salipiger sp. 1_MG-2023 TaxID=3062665 RepID=UPI0026E1DE55|nr:glycosyltransferase family 2 protein [Salipiger sp. 1_MG-2023]MDO6587000.1 glycosyltransferase family 2 protein [Salipiger sp. 1_MG-2023]